MTTDLMPQTHPVILGHEPIAADVVLDTSDAIKLTNANGCMITVLHADLVGTNVVLTVHEGATAVLAAAGGTPITTAFPIWINLDCATNDTMVRQTDAITYTITATGTGQNAIVQFYIPAAILLAGNDWIHLGQTGGNAGDYESVLYQLDGARYQQETPPTAVA